MANQIIDRLTYGELPTKEAFLSAVVIDGDDKITFGNDERFGTTTVTAEELWSELDKAAREFWEGSEKSGDWASFVLSSLGFEWV